MSGDLRISDIIVGERDRQELGDISELARSIEQVGLLHPVVITEDGELVAGDRRLAAVKSLGWECVPVTVVSLETAADVLRAEADENACRKGLTPYEAARARERRAKLLAPKARERQGERTDLKSEPRTNLVPSSSAATKTKNVASAGTGYSGSTLDKVDKIRDVAERGVIKRGKAEIPAPAPVVEIARKALEDVKQTGAAVERSSRDLNAAVEAYVGTDPDVQRARLAKQFSDAMSRAIQVIQFNAENVAAVIEPGEWDDLEREFDALAKFWKQLKSHRPQGLRLIGGTRV
ncbi:ParB N-terminal domain-containing protein (plasmid) [Nocardia sp. CA-151230]|uniref:ParB N-terminal domain-containing protein n=1 Tax=Nocardia sp. CA-151230 TaxID=3239982 RepID=UPI003D8B7C04